MRLIAGELADSFRYKAARLNVGDILSNVGAKIMHFVVKSKISYERSTKYRLGY